MTKLATAHAGPSGSAARDIEMSYHSKLCAALNEQIGDKYEVLRWIGGGGMADVFLARHRVSGGRAAVKLLAERLADNETLVKRFVAEAQMAATLGRHPNIVSIFDVASGGGMHWIIMQYVEGEDLSSYLDRRKQLPEAEALWVVRGVAEALSCAASHDVVHRDIKPSNIRIDTNGGVIVLDFGIAKAGDGPTGLTRPGLTPGTPYYMSPEQARGEKCTFQSDLYSLGLVFFEMLTGESPFGEDVYSVSPAFGKLSRVDPSIVKMVKRLLQARPEDRYSSADELVADVDAALRRLPPVRLEPGREAGPGRDDTHESEGGQASEDSGREENRVTEVDRGGGGRRWKSSPLAAGACIALVVTGAWFVRRLVGNPHPLPSVAHSSETGPRPAPAPAPVYEDAHGRMVLVPAGKFIFGDDAPDSPNKRQELELPAFYIDETETSNELYAAFTSATGHALPDSTDFQTAPNLPVGNVTFTDAETYCSWAGRRLPTEEEWEKAARGPDGFLFPWGNQPLPNPGKLVPVDALPERKSWVGALNLCGNVFEWTTSEFPVTEQELDDMKALTKRTAVSRDWRNIKGGSFLVKNNLFFRSFMRRGWPADQKAASIGFRCVKDAN